MLEQAETALTDYQCGNELGVGRAGPIWLWFALASGAGGGWRDVGS